MIRNWVLIFGYMNTTTPHWLDRRLSSRLTSDSFLSFSAYFWDCFKFDCIYTQIFSCCICLNWNRHRGMLPRAALPSKLVQALIVREQLWSFDPCHYSRLPLIQFVNKLVTNSETRDTPHKIKHCEIYWVKAPMRARTSFLRRRISSISHCFAADSRTEQVSFYLSWFPICSLQKECGFPMCCCWFSGDEMLSLCLALTNRLRGVGGGCWVS